VLTDVQNAVNSVAAVLSGVPMMFNCFVVACNVLHERLHPELVIRDTPPVAVAQPAAQPGAAATSSVWVADKILDSDESFGNTCCAQSCARTKSSAKLAIGSSTTTLCKRSSSIAGPQCRLSLQLPAFSFSI
jgi:hypothetical protein